MNRYLYAEEMFARFIRRSMSFFSWITGGSFATQFAQAESFFENKHYGDAKLAYQRSLKKSKEASQEQIAQVKQRIERCAVELAEAKIHRACELFHVKQVDAALDCLEEVLSICDNDEIRQRVEQYRESFWEQGEDNGEDTPDEMSEEDLLAVICGAWSVAQSKEFTQYSEVFYKGIIKAHDGEHDAAVKLLEEVIQNNDETLTQFIYLELGRQQLLADDYQGALKSLETFIKKCGDLKTAKDELVMSYILLSNIHLHDNNPKLAEEVLMKAFRADPDNHIPLLSLGIFLRDEGELERSKRTLENAMDTMGAMQPDMRVFRELGHTMLALGQRAEAIEMYKAVIDQCCKHGDHGQYDPEAAVPLAKLFEEDAKIREASDIYRHLAKGNDIGNLFEYNIESVRLLLACGEDLSIIDEYLVQAGELAKNEPQQKEVALLRKRVDI